MSDTTATTQIDSLICTTCNNPIVIRLENYYDNNVKITYGCIQCLGNSTPTTTVNYVMGAKRK